MHKDAKVEQATTVWRVDSTGKEKAPDNSEERSGTLIFSVSALTIHWFDILKRQKNENR